MNKITKRLHHRSPYLFIDDIIEASQEFIHVIKTPHIEEFYLKGHFPGTPIVPGAIMQEMTTQAGGLLITEFYSPEPDYDSEATKGHALGVLRSIHSAKYRKFARPGDVLHIKATLLMKLETSFRFKAHIEVNGEKIMMNEFTLVNLTEDQLKGIRP
jgi:3-hydroxyacyl-[acyl-carrier-protein] dehydratase